MLWRITRSLLFCLLLCLLLGACGEEERLAPEPAPEAPEPAGPETETLPEPTTVDAPTYGQQRMHDRYDGVEALRDAIVRGDLDVARAVARGLDRPVGIGHLPASAHALTDLVPGRAAAVAEASDEALPGAYARLVSGCGECHESAQISWRYDDSPPPPDGDLDAHMQRHAWAVERMWQALIVANDARFNEGAEVLAEAPFVSADATEDPSGLSAVAERIHARARDAASAPDHEARAAIYGDILGGCRTCHAQIEAMDEEEGTP